MVSFIIFVEYVYKISYNLLFHNIFGKRVAHFGNSRTVTLVLTLTKAKVDCYVLDLLNFKSMESCEYCEGIWWAQITVTCYQAPSNCRYNDTVQCIDLYLYVYTKKYILFTTCHL